MTDYAPEVFTPDPEGLSSLLQRVAVAVVVPTEVEARPVRARLSGHAVGLRIARKDWTVARLGSGGAEVPVALVVSGFDKANTAHALTCLLQAHRPDLVLQVGVAGGFGAAGARVGDLVLASSETYADTGASSPDGWLGVESFGLPLAEVGGRAFWNTFPLDTDRVEGAAARLVAHQWPSPAPRIVTGPFVTLSQVSGTAEAAAALAERWHPVAESMEGAAAAQVCLLYDVPFLEVRGVSNLVGDRDRASWDVPRAATLAAEAAATLCAALAGDARV